MSIFKSSFSQTVQDQLKVRQGAMRSRTVNNLQYLNSRNAWIRMTSSVNVNGTNDLAKKYILQGGTLNLNTNAKDLKGVSKKQGIGNFDNAYSIGIDPKNPYQRGIRPMPGIISADIKSKTAYGSLREVVVNFQCWDIQQLEDLEVLYMRPGYTVLVEWGWTPYLDNKGEYQSDFTDYYDIINSPSQDRTALFKALFNKSVQHGGNYDAMFGYVKNYQWSARMDGGYDCQTTIITTGEIIESLKVNYILPLDIKSITQQQQAVTNYIQNGGTTPQQPTVPYAISTPPPQPTLSSLLPSGIQQVAANAGNTGGLLVDEFTGPGASVDLWSPAYQQNVLAGVWAETFWKIKKDVLEKTIDFSTNSNSAFIMNGGGGACTSYVPIIETINNQNSLAQGSGPNQVYISIGAMCEILNKYIIAKGSDGQPLIRLFVKANEYDQTQPTGSYLYCTAHPLQVSVDPSVCLIKNPLWIGGDVINTVSASIAPITYTTEAEEIFSLLVKAFAGSGTNTRKLKEGFALLASYGKDKGLQIYYIVEQFMKDKKSSNTSFNEDYSSLQDMLNGELGLGNVLDMDTIILYLKQIGITSTYDLTDYGLGVSNIVITAPPNTLNTAALTTLATKSPQALSNLEYLNKLPLDYFYENKPESEIGIIKNIFVNVDYLYQRALDTGLQSGDQNQRNEISLYTYLKKIISDIQSSIGNVNNFEIHVDPVDNNVARIIDINYTEPDKAIYDKLFELQVHNLNSIVRSYSLQSQIFPNQSALIAIGSQAKGGQLGMQTNTMIDFNRSLTDRIITEKVDGIGSRISVNSNNQPTITNGLANIISLFSSLNQSKTSTETKTDQKTDYSVLASSAKNSLRDLIVYFQSIVKSPGSNRNLIPTKFSCEMDGIGGLVIGHMFRLPDNIMPRGYRGEGVGSKLGNAITSIGHTISNGDWSTKIDTLNIVLDDSKSQFFALDLSQIKSLIEFNITSPNITPKPTNPNIKITPPTNSDDIEIYKAILTGIGAPITDQNLKYFYAWRQAEGGDASWNPFNTTWSHGFKVTPNNCNAGNPVKNYASKQDGISATILTLKQNYYNKIRNGLINDVGASTISSYFDELFLWGTRTGINNVLSGNNLTPPPIAKSPTVRTC